jgi:hypothetical protein
VIIVRQLDSDKLIKVSRVLVPTLHNGKRLRQFPIEIAFAIGVKKAQGLTLKKVVYSYQPFIDDKVHGLLNSALTRVRKLSDLTIDMTRAQSYIHDKKCCKVMYKDELLKLMNK